MVQFSNRCTNYRFMSNDMNASRKQNHKYCAFSLQTMVLMADCVPNIRNESIRPIEKFKLCAAIDVRLTYVIPSVLFCFFLLSKALIN